MGDLLGQFELEVQKKDCGLSSNPPLVVLQTTVKAPLIWRRFTEHWSIVTEVAEAPNEQRGEPLDSLPVL